MLKIDSRSRSEVGRIVLDDGLFKIRPRNFPPTMRMRWKLSLTFGASGLARHSFYFSVFREQAAKRARSARGAAAFARARSLARVTAPKNLRSQPARLFRRSA